MFHDVNRLKVYKIIQNSVYLLSGIGNRSTQVWRFVLYLLWGIRNGKREQPGAFKSGVLHVQTLKGVQFICSARLF